LWNIPEPELIISIHGSDIHPELSSGGEVATFVKEDIYKTAAATKAWLMTDGMSDGVAELIGSARHEHLLDMKDVVPLIGFPLWTDIKNRESFLCTELEHQKITDDPASPRHGLDVNHSYLLIVDPSEGGLDRQNFAFRRRLSDFMRNSRNKNVIPTVNFLVAGELSDLRKLKSNLVEGEKLVLFEGSGGAAEVLIASINLYKKKLENYRYDQKIQAKIRAEGLSTSDWVENTGAYGLERKKVLKMIKSIDISNMVNNMGIRNLKGNYINQWKELIIYILDNYQELLIVHGINRPERLTRKLMESIWTSELGNLGALNVAMQLNLVPLMAEKISRLTTKEHRTLVSSEKSQKLFFKAILQNDIQFVSLFMKLKIDLTESKAMSNEVIKLFKKVIHFWLKKVSGPKWTTSQLLKVTLEFTFRTRLD